MIGSIRKLSKSIFAKFLVALIALPLFFGAWDVFQSSNQNVIAEINEKNCTKEFMDYLRAVNITRDEIENEKKMLLMKFNKLYKRTDYCDWNGRKGIQLSDHL